jgi:hypothetical protein
MAPKVQVMTAVMKALYQVKAILATLVMMALTDQMGVEEMMTLAEWRAEAAQVILLLLQVQHP